MILQFSFCALQDFCEPVRRWPPPFWRKLWERSRGMYSPPLPRRRTRPSPNYSKSSTLRPRRTMPSFSRMPSVPLSSWMLPDRNSQVSLTPPQIRGLGSGRRAKSGGICLPRSGQTPRWWQMWERRLDSPCAGLRGLRTLFIRRRPWLLNFMNSEAPSAPDGTW